jgi:endonuclease G, mitochondrial
MDDSEFEAGLRSLEVLAAAEYHQSLARVAGDPDDVYAAVRIGRLVGVSLKEPFAESREVKTPSQRTAAYRSWDLVGSEQEFERPDRVGQWQYMALQEIKVELGAESPHMREWSTYDFAYMAQNEEGFFGYFAQAVRRYICGDPELRAKVEEAISAARKGGIGVGELNPEVVVASGGVALGTYLVATVPVLGFVGVPVVAALVLILYRLGVEGFCKWTNRLRTDEDEKH